MPKPECAICHAEDKPLMRYMATQMCGQCMQKEINNQNKIDSSANTRIKAAREIAKVDTLSRQVEVDSSIRFETDLFNAETVSIVDIKAAIDEDSTIENKNYELAERLVTRQELFQEKLFKVNKVQAEIASLQRAGQSYLNDLSHRLRNSERDKLRLSDMSYKPKPAKAAKTKAPKKKTYDKAELSLAAEKAGVAASTIQAMCVAKNIQPSEVVDFLETLKTATQAATQETTQ